MSGRSSRLQCWLCRSWGRSILKPEERQLVRWEPEAAERVRTVQGAEAQAVQAVEQAQIEQEAEQAVA